ncbi:MAG: NMD3-related protein [Candidatus Methanoperedens sp.]|jgi:nonsense-mediated mRNA decay protein 3|nr:NMD3-related protein [Candidatus Methanoperedens sp.]PKL53829.1 MAG: NMD protein affecting ribosome stability and mRNA decay [Candidatus Methanoperedenaceae archaeon HGW-Methanoperedenaceae-1]
MSSQFCPKCGKDTDVLFENVCKECFLKTHKLIGCPLVIHIKTCPTCGSFFRKGKWAFSNDETKNVKDSVLDEISIDKKAKNAEIVLTLNKLDKLMYRVGIEVTAEINGIPITEETETEVRVGREACDACSRIAGGYFEGIVQVRAENRLPTKEELARSETIARELAGRYQDKGDRLSFISRVVELDEGIDLYVSSTKLGKQVCNAVIEVFGGKFSESPTLIGQKDGIEIYRVTFALRLPEFVRGDIVGVGDSVIEVQNYGKHLRGTDLETGKKFMEASDRIGKIAKLGSLNDAVSSVLVMYEGNTIQVLDPETYESVTIRKPEFLDVEAGNEIRIIKTKKGIFVLP